jgi:signal transduction histidine kinase
MEITQLAGIKVAVGMVSPENRLSGGLDSLTPTVREQQRLKALAESRLLEAETIPVFEEATQTAAHFLDVPICILGLMDKDRQWFKSAVGLSRLGLMNQLAASRQLPRHESFCTHVVENKKVLVISNTASDPVFSQSILVQHYGIRAYLGVPLMTSTGHCLGTLAVMERVPRTFTSKEVEFLELMARWSMSEFERNRLLKGGTLPEVQVNLSAPMNLNVSSSPSGQLSTNQVQVKLLSALTQELRTPLTSVMGMASVLGREIYGPLTSKQKEYLEIIQTSGQYLLTLVNEILALGGLDASNSALKLTATDIEMICQQAIATLEETASRREQEIRLTVEPGNRIWQLDKEKVRQMLYHLVASVLQRSEAQSIVRIHISRKGDGLNVAVWVSHPWLGEGLPHVEPYVYPSPLTALSNYPEATPDSDTLEWEEQSGMSLPPAKELTLRDADDDDLTLVPDSNPFQGQNLNQSRENLGLLLSCHLAQMHAGQISIQGSPESGYRYVLTLPNMMEIDETL